MTGLSGLEFTSATGPRSRLIPTSASSRPIARPTDRVSAGSSATPRASGPSTGLPSRTCSRVTSPPSSSTATTAPGDTERTCAVYAATASGPSAVLDPNRQSPPSPSSSSGRASWGSDVPGNDGSSTRSAQDSMLMRGSPLHRPGREPGDHPALDQQEEDDHRHRDERGARHHATPVDTPVDVEEAGLPDRQRLLVLAGHDHDGQVVPPWMKPNTPVATRPVASSGKVTLQN